VKYKGKRASFQLAQILPAKYLTPVAIFYFLFFLFFFSVPFKTFKHFFHYINPLRPNEKSMQRKMTAKTQALANKR